MDNKIQINRKYKSEDQKYDLYINSEDISFPVFSKYENGVVSFFIIKKQDYPVINEHYNENIRTIKYFNLRIISNG